jgi:hypothetical protein
MSEIVCERKPPEGLSGPNVLVLAFVLSMNAAPLAQRGTELGDVTSVELMLTFHKRYFTVVHEHVARIDIDNALPGNIEVEHQAGMFPQAGCFLDIFKEVVALGATRKGLAIRQVREIVQELAVNVIPV